MKHLLPSLAARPALAALLALLLGGASAYAQSSSPTGQDQPTASSSSTTTSQKLGFMDRRFVTKASDFGTNELQMARLAAQRATNPDVRSFAEQLVSDQSLANWELTHLADQKNLKLDFDDGKDRAYRRLSTKSGSEFDEEFVAHVIEERERDLKNYERAAQNAKDADVRTYAARQVDQLRQQLHTCQQLRTSIMPTGRDNTWSGRPDETKPKPRPDNGSYQRNGGR